MGHNYIGHTYMGHTDKGMAYTSMLMSVIHQAWRHGATTPRSAASPTLIVRVGYNYIVTAYMAAMPDQ